METTVTVLKTFTVHPFDLVFSPKKMPHSSNIFYKILDVHEGLISLL